MNIPRRPCRRPSLQLVALATFGLAAALASPASHADPGDFGAMPGLWKIVTRLFSHGRWGRPVAQWHCVDEGADPWASFGHIDPPATHQCQQAGQRRSSTTLDWTLRCQGKAATTMHGHVGFDAAEHYTARLTLPDGTDVARVEGKRYAACTSPAD
jgi:hypothetical protein